MKLRKPSLVPLPQLIPLSEVKRKVRGIVVTFVVTLAVSLLIAGILVTTVVPGSELPSLVILSLAFAFIAAGIAALIVGWTYSLLLQSTLGGDTAVTKRVNRAVLHNKGERLDGDELVLAARWAAIMTVSHPIQAIGSATNLIGVGLLQLNVLFSPGTGVFRPIAGVTLVIVVAALILTVLVFGLQTARARGFTRRHGDVLRTGARL